ncbi:ferrochelatase [Litorimonas sp. RW-G-Af-16]|uniref:ferrochelatase n=1 Tax=Litorimonas sp. RW-G-Af-16 TaxID=3241168 RepID=UPI00390C7E21
MGDKPGLLLVNLGSPDAPTAKATRKYLGQFLHDYRVIDTTRWLWCPILHGIILRVRPAKSAKAYASIWAEPEGLEGPHDKMEAPLVRITRGQAEGVQARLGENVEVEIAMRYGNPSIGHGLDALKAKGCTRIAVLPLYPQYAGATTASVYDGVAMALEERMDVPELRFLRHYYDDPRYIAALASSIDDHLATLDWTPDCIMTSYHGLPQSYVDKGDPYQGECFETTELLRQHMGKTKSELYATFQSRFGPKAWLQPYTDKTLEKLPDEGVKKVAVMMPGFSADCLETLEEIKIEAHETFEEHGGTHFTAIPCLNTREDHLDLLADLARERLLNGWL